MPGCAVFGCNNYNRKTKGSEIKYYKFPRNDDLARMWINACKRNYKINVKNACICSVHFHKKSYHVPLKQQLLNYTPKNSRNLKPDAIPTENLPTSGKSERKFGDTNRVLRHERRNRKTEVSELLNEEALENEADAIVISTVVKMNSHIESELFDEEDPLSNNEIKTEPLDIKCEIKPEPEECYKFAEHINVKHEIEPISQIMSSDKIVSEVKGTEESLSKNSQDVQKNIDKLETTVIPILHDSCETYGRSLQEEDCDHTADKANICSEHKNSCFDHSNPGNCTQTADKYFTCNICNKCFHDKCTYTEHLYSHVGNKTFSCNFSHKSFACNVCSKSFSQKKTLLRHKLIHTHVKPFTCNLCGKSLSDKSKFIGHTRIHTNEKPFICNICSKSFSLKSTLTEHVRNHTNVKRFTCIYCKSSFTYKSKLVRHMRIHTNEKPFTCSFCNKSFSDKSKLSIHSRFHTNEKPFSCNFCSKLFSVKSNLVQHTHIHEGKSFKCNTCSKSFSNKQALVHHTHIHTNEKPFTCNFCSKSFSHKSNLVRHTRIHTNQKPFTCNFCRKSFSQKSTLAEHTRVHTNDKPFQCNFCSKSFSQKSTLILHTRRIHSSHK